MSRAGYRASYAWKTSLLSSLYEQPLQSVVEEALSEGGFATAFASSGDEAVKLLSASKNKYCALVTDINLGRGKMDGWSQLRTAMGARFRPEG